MKKKIIYTGIAIVAIVLGMTLNFNMLQSKNQGDISLANINIMAQASAENHCTYDYIGYFCYKYAGGDSYCTSGTSGSCLHPE